MRTRNTPYYRLFFALKPPTQIERQIDHFTKTVAPDAHRVLPAHQHMTLAITPDYDVYPYEVVRALLQAGTRVMAEAFDLRLDHLSISNRSLALRPSNKPSSLSQLQREIAQAVRSAGVTERPGWSFNPHQTLGYRDGRPEHHAVEGFGWPVEEFALICSHVGHTRHDQLGVWPLTGDAQYSLF